MLEEKDAWERCVLGKYQERLKNYTLGQPKEIGDLFFDIKGVYNYCRDRMWNESAHMNSTLKKHGTSILEELALIIVISDDSVQEKIQALKFLDDKIRDGMLLLKRYMSGVGDIDWDENAVKYLSRFLVEKGNDSGHFASCYDNLTNFWQEVFGQ